MWSKLFEHQPRDGEGADVVEAGRPAAVRQLVAVGMERERNERVEAGRALLRFAQANEMIDAILERLDVPVEHRRVAGDALAVQLFVQLDPVRGRHFVRTDLRARLFGKDLRGAAVDVVETRRFQLGDDLRKRHAVALGHVLDLGRGEERELHVRQRGFEAAHQRQPIVERELARIVSADDVDLVEVRAGLDRLGEDLIGRHAEDALRLLELVGRKRAERAARKADVRRVDVAV